MAWGGFPPYVSAAERRARATKALAKLAKRGTPIEGVAIEGKQIARTFWGPRRVVCDNLERYADFAYRLERGRTYMRNGSVVHLAMSPGVVVTRYVSGSALYATVQIAITACTPARWKSLCADCGGGIDSLVELLQGRFGAGVIERLCRMGDGLFPTPHEIRFACRLPRLGDRVCKHVAAVLYGVGARLDAKPELLFALRAVDPAELLASASRRVGALPSIAKSRVLPAARLGIFGLELVDAPDAPRVSAKQAKAPRPRASRSKSAR